jgi:hypothetical protein
MSLIELANEGRFKAHKTSKSEINQLLAVFNRDIEDAQIINLSIDRRFIMAYGAALTVAIAALAASGYRAASGGHHYWTIQSLVFTLGKHSIYTNGVKSVPAKRHRTLDRITANELCKRVYKIRLLLSDDGRGFPSSKAPTPFP